MLVECALRAGFDLQSGIKKNNTELGVQRSESIPNSVSFTPSLTRKKGRMEGKREREGAKTEGLLNWLKNGK